MNVRYSGFYKRLDVLEPVAVFALLLVFCIIRNEECQVSGDTALRKVALKLGL